MHQTIMFFIIIIIMLGRIGGLDIKYLLYINVYSLRNFYAPKHYLFVFIVCFFDFLFGCLILLRVFFWGGGGWRTRYKVFVVYICILCIVLENFLCTQPLFVFCFCFLLLFLLFWGGLGG